MQKIDACGMLAQWPVSWGAAPKAEGPLSTNYRRSAAGCAKNPVSITTVRQTGDSGQDVRHCDYRGSSGTYRFPTPRQFVMFSLCSEFFDFAQ
jgi:hypothetical protein